MMSGTWTGLNGLAAFKWPWPSKRLLTTKLLNDVDPEIELSDYRQIPSPGSESPSGFLNGESLKLEPISDLDLFFERVYNYYCGKGLWCIVTKWIFELLSLAFMIFFSGFFLLFVDWRGLSNAKCGIDAVGSGIKPCDLAKEAIHPHPLVPFTFIKGIVVGYLGILSVIWIFFFIRFFVQLKNTLEIRHFYYNSLNVTDHEVQTTPWEAILDRIVQFQSSQQLCVVKDLSAHDVVMRIMRKENYLIGMINKNVLAFPIPWWVPGAGPTVDSRPSGQHHCLVLTKTLQWILKWFLLQSMFDRNFCIRRDFISNPTTLKRRLIFVGLGVFLLSPCLVIAMLVYLFLSHAEQFYHHPSLACSRRWSNLSKWIFREFNEVDHLFTHRINNSVEHAANYLKQFPSPIINVIAKFVSFVAGGFAAVLIIIAFLEESLLEGHIFGRNLFWYAAVFGTVTAISRAAISDELQVLDPEGAMSLVVQHTHYMPKRWRGKENTDKVRKEFETLYQYTGMLLLEEMVSILLTPYLLIFVVPKHVEDILQFISEFTVAVEGVGDVCSLSVFNFVRHGNKNYASPFHAPRAERSSQGKMEKSFLSFQSSYPSWEANDQGKQLLSSLQIFWEQQIRHQGTYIHPQAWPYPVNSNIRQQGEYQGAVARDILCNRVVPQGPGYYLNSLWPLNIDHKNPPYLLDWYYTSIKSQSVDRRAATTYPVNPPEEPSRDFWVGSSSNNDAEVRPTCEEVNWGFFVDEDRNRSHLEASTSRPFFRDSVDSVLHHQDRSQMEHAAQRQSHWWARSGQKLSDPQASFLEPPSFGVHNVSHPYDNFSDRSDEEQEGGDRRGGSYGVDSLLRSSHMLSHTGYMNDYAEDELRLNLPFNDVFGGPLRNLPTKIIPAADDHDCE